MVASQTGHPDAAIRGDIRGPFMPASADYIYNLWQLTLWALVF